MYTNEKNAQVILSLLKAHGIRHAVLSPGTTNFGIVSGMQNDPFFKIVSAPDERSGAYIACGIAEMTGSPVAISCTGATASRNYLPALTEAFYRKLPIIALTSFNGTRNVGQLMPQNLDRMHAPNDISVASVDIPRVKDEEDALFVAREINKALLACRAHGGGPVHINIECDYSKSNFTTNELPKVRSIRYFSYYDSLPTIDQNEKIAVFIGAHRVFMKSEIEALEHFAEKYNAAILTDHTSNYRGKKTILASLASENTNRWSSYHAKLIPDLIIDLGEVSGDYLTVGFLRSTKAPVWRLSLDGQIRQRFGRLEAICEFSVEDFFTRLAEAAQKDSGPCAYFEAWKKRDTSLRENIPNIAFTNRWIAGLLSKKLPKNAVLHLAILNSLRSWDYYPIDSSIDCFSNTGGFGIDGCMSTAIGAALSNPDRVNYLVIGDLAFFYDMNSLGNRDLPKNIRILLINNGLGVEFRMPYSPAYVLGEEVNEYIAAGNHYQLKAPKDETGYSPAQAWCTAMGLEYRSAANKQEFTSCVEWFTTDNNSAGPKILECFIDPADEETAALLFASIDKEGSQRQKIASKAKEVIPSSIVDKLRKTLN